MSYKNYLVLARIMVKNANALSSPITVGIPSISAFLGVAHKLEREIRKKEEYDSVRFTGVGIVIHEARLQTYKGADGVENLVSYGKPLARNGGRASMIPDPRIDLCVSLICEIDDSDFQIDDDNQFLRDVDEIVINRLKIAGGDILSPRLDGKSCNSFLVTKQIQYYKSVDDEEPLENRKVLRSVMPGYAIIERKDLMDSEMKNGKDAVNALIDYLAIHHDCSVSEDGSVSWNVGRKTCGWLVPISVGYQGLSAPSYVSNLRDDGYKHVFGENLITLGEFKIVNSFHSISDFTWRYETDMSKSQYKCVCNGGN